MSDSSEEDGAQELPPEDDHFYDTQASLQRPGLHEGSNTWHIPTAPESGCACRHLGSSGDPQLWLIAALGRDCELCRPATALLLLLLLLRRVASPSTCKDSRQHRPTP